MENNNENSNKIAVFLAEIPNIIYRVAFILGWLAVIIYKSIKAGGFLAIFSGGWSIFIFIVDLIIVGSLLSTVLIVICGFIIKKVTRG